MSRGGGSLTAWLILLGFLGTFGVAAMGVGVWKAGVDSSAINARTAMATANMASLVASASKSATDSLASKVVQLDATVSDLRNSNHALMASIDRLNVAVRSQQQLVSYIGGLKKSADAEHSKLEHEDDLLRKQSDELDERVQKIERAKKK